MGRIKDRQLCNGCPVKMVQKIAKPKLENEDWVKELISHVEQSLSQPNHIAFAKNVMQLIEDRLKSKRILKTNAVAIRYVDPDNDKNKWSGRGKRPVWLKEKLEAGFTEDQFEV